MLGVMGEQWFADGSGRSRPGRQAGWRSAFHSGRAAAGPPAGRTPPLAAHSRRIRPCRRPWSDPSTREYTVPPGSKLKMPESSKALRRISLSMLSMIQAGLRTQQMTLAAGNSCGQRGQLGGPLRGWCRTPPCRGWIVGVIRIEHRPSAGAGAAPSSMNTAASLRGLVTLQHGVEQLPTGLVMPAEKRGFCRSNAASSVEPERGRPEMKWMPFCIVNLSRVLAAAVRGDGSDYHWPGSVQNVARLPAVPVRARRAMTRAHGPWKKADAVIESGGLSGRNPRQFPDAPSTIRRSNLNNSPIHP